MERPDDALTAAAASAAGVSTGGSRERSVADATATTIAATPTEGRAGTPRRRGTLVTGAAAATTAAVPSLAPTGMAHTAPSLEPRRATVPDGAAPSRDLTPWATAAFIAGVATFVLMLVGVATPLRVIGALVFIGFGPGLAVVPLLGVRDTLAQVTLVASVSLALAAFVASTLAYAGAWSPLATMLVLLGISAAGLVGQRTLAIRTRRTLAR